MGAEPFVSEDVLEQTRCLDVSLSYACNARCRFCSQDPARRGEAGLPLRKAARRIHEAYAAGFRRLGFSGGEPTAAPDLARLIAFGRRTGYRSVRLQTNGLRLADARYAQALAEAGLTTARLSVHGTPEVHDSLVGVAGAHERLEKAAENLRGLGLRLGVNVVLTRACLQGLGELCERWLLSKGLTSFTFIRPLAYGAMAAHTAELEARCGELAAAMERVCRLFEREGLEPPLLLHFTPCLLPGRETRMLGWHRFDAWTVEPDGTLGDLDENVARVKGRPDTCAGCAYEERCPGVDRGYLERHGSGEFRPLPRRAPSRGGPPSSDPRRRLLTENELCVLSLVGRGPLDTDGLMTLAEAAPLCQDCRGGAAVLAAAERLLRMGRVRRVRRGGRYLWTAVDRRQEAL